MLCIEACPAGTVVYRGTQDAKIMICLIYTVFSNAGDFQGYTDYVNTRCFTAKTTSFSICTEQLVEIVNKYCWFVSKNQKSLHSSSDLSHSVCLQALASSTAYVKIVA